MVWEERFYAEPKDVISIRIKCRNCEGASSIPLRGSDHYLPETCAQCRERWFLPGSSDHKMVTWLLQSLNGLKQRDEKVTCDIHFELPGHLNMPNGK